MRKRAVALPIAVLLVGALVWWGWLRSPTIADLRSVADAFDPPSGWTLVEENARGRGPLCIDTECPSLTRRWETTAPPTQEDLAELLIDAGWSTVAWDGSCLVRQNVTGSSSLCTASIEDEGVITDVRLAGPIPTSSGAIFWVSLHVHP